MKSLKATVVIIAALILMTSCARGGGSRQSRDGGHDDNDSVAWERVNDTTVSTTTVETRETRETTETAPVTETEDPSGLTMGEVQDGVYTNDYLGIVFAPPEDWTFEEQLEFVQLPSDVLANGTTLTLCYAESDSSWIPYGSLDMRINTIESIDFEDEFQGLLDHGTDPEEIEDLLVIYSQEHVTGIVDGWDAANVEYSNGSIEFMGATHPQFTVTGETEGFPFRITVVAVVYEEYVISVTALSLGSSDENSTMEILGWVEHSDGN